MAEYLSHLNSYAVMFGVFSNPFTYNFYSISYLVSIEIYFLKMQLNVLRYTSNYRYYSPSPNIVIINH